MQRPCDEAEVPERLLKLPHKWKCQLNHSSIRHVTTFLSFFPLFPPHGLIPEATENSYPSGGTGVEAGNEPKQKTRGKKEKGDCAFLLQLQVSCLQQAQTEKGEKP